MRSEKTRRQPTLSHPNNPRRPSFTPSTVKPRARNLASQYLASLPPALDHSLFSDAREAALTALHDTLMEAHAPETTDRYDGNVRRFVEFCATLGISEPDALPCSDDLLCVFLASNRGRIGRGTAKNYISSIRAWHVKRNFPWLPSPRRALILKAMHMCRPSKDSKPNLRAPVTPFMLSLLVLEWENGSRKERAALAGALACWFGMMRLGEFFARTPSKCDDARLPARFEWRPSSSSRDRSAIHLPWTKTTFFDGAIVQLTDLNLPFNASRAMQSHLRSSKLKDDDLLCQFQSSDGDKMTLDKLEFIRMCRAVWEPAGIKDVSGHSFRIGGTDSLLKAGVSTDIVKSMGRWKSDAFLVYWRDYEAIFARATESIHFNLAEDSATYRRRRIGQLGAPRSVSQSGRRS